MDKPANRPEYIVLLWPAAEYAESIEAYRREICRACDAKTTMAWPAHMSLQYGITTPDVNALAAALRVLARETSAMWLTVEGLGIFPEGTLYLEIMPGPDVTALQASIRDVIGKFTVSTDAGASSRGDPTVLHITLASHLQPEHRATALQSAHRLFETLPKAILADRMSLAVFDATSGISDTIEAFSLAAGEQA